MRSEDKDGIELKLYLADARGRTTYTWNMGDKNGVEDVRDGVVIPVNVSNLYARHGEYYIKVDFSCRIGDGREATWLDSIDYDSILVDVVNEGDIGGISWVASLSELSEDMGKIILSCIQREEDRILCGLTGYSPLAVEYRKYIEGERGDYV